MRRRESEERRLIERATKGEQGAFVSLYNGYVAQIYRHVQYRVPSQPDAEDITQEVFIKTYHWGKAPFISWLLAIARNLIIDHYRARKKVVSLEKATAVGGPASTMVATTNDLDKSRVRSAIMKLQGDMKKVVLLRSIVGFSYAETARMLRKSEGAVRVMHYRALNELRRILGTA